MQALLTLALLVAACDSLHHSRSNPDAGYQFPDGGDVRMSGSDGMPSMTPTAFLDQWETKYCATAFMCKNNYPNNTGQTFTQAFGQSATECHAIMSSYDMAMSVEQYVTQGSITWNASSAQTCISSFGYSTCNS